MIELERIRVHQYEFRGEIYEIDDSIVKKGHRAMTRDLVYQIALKTFEENDRVSERLIEKIMRWFGLEIIDDKNKPIDGCFKKVGDYYKGLVNIKDFEYFDMINKAIKEFLVRKAKRVNTNIMFNDLRTVIENKNNEMYYLSFANKYFEPNNIKIEILHEQIEETEFNKCVNLLADIVNEYSQNQLTIQKIKFLGYRTKPVPALYKNKDNEEKLGCLEMDQPDEKEAIFFKRAYNRAYVLVPTINENNKIANIKIIRGEDVGIYNFVLD